MNNAIDLEHLLNGGADRSMTLELRGQPVEIRHNVAGHATYLELARFGLEVEATRREREERGEDPFLTPDELKKIMAVIDAHLVEVGGNPWMDLSEAMRSRVLNSLSRSQQLDLYYAIRHGELPASLGKSSTSTSSESTASPPADASDAEDSSVEPAS